MKQYKTCPRCKIPKAAKDFYLRRSGTGLTPYCKVCHNNQAKERQKRLKEQAVAYKGGRCEICNYDACVAAMDFHHTDPTQKDFTISHSKCTAFDKVKYELDKCILLCCRCHREIESGFTTLTKECLDQI